MTSAPDNPAQLALAEDFALGGARISPSTRTIRGPLGKAVVEPRMMQVLLVMAGEQGRLVTRDRLLKSCWSGMPVGDDSLNRAVAGLRRALTAAAGNAVRLVTVPGSGYTLYVDEGHAHVDADADHAWAALKAGWQSWKLGLPVVDHEALGHLRQAAARHSRRADVHGMLALVLRSAAEYADLDLCTSLVHECEAVAAQALALDPRQIHARAALIGLPPLFGDWPLRRRRLLEALDETHDNPVALHDLSMLEMATGRPRAAEVLSARLIELEPLAATLHYKRTYQLWSVDRLADMDRVADRGMQLWPRHAAIWHARLWSLAFTGRSRQALQQLSEVASLPDLPAPVFATLEKTLAAIADPGNPGARRVALQANLEAAERGPAQSIAAVIHLAGLGEVDGAFRVAEGYLLRRGPVSVGVHKTAADPSITDQHRRVTQMLFLPVTAPLRDDARFLRLCDDMGLTAYWESAGVAPDFLSAGRA